MTTEGRRHDPAFEGGRRRDYRTQLADTRRLGVTRSFGASSTSLRPIETLRPAETVVPEPWFGGGFAPLTGRQWRH